MKKIIFAMAVLLSVDAFAQTLWSTHSQVTNVRVRENIAYLKVASCNKYAKIKLDTTYEMMMYSTAMAALTNNKYVTVELKGGSCNSGEYYVNYIDLAK